MPYQNIGFAPGRSTFAKVTTEGTNDELIFTSKATSVPISGGKVQMVSSSVTLNHAKDVTISEAVDAPKAYVNNSVKLSYNVVKGDGTAFLALMDEVERVTAAARTQYNLDNGLVPTGTATFPAS